MNVSLRVLVNIRVVFIFLTVIGLGVLYDKYNLVHFFPVVFVSCMSLLICRLKAKAWIKLTKMQVASLSVFIIMMASVGYMAGYDDGTMFDGLLCLWFYMVLSDCLLSIVMSAILSSDRKHKAVYAAPRIGSGSEINHVNGHIAAAYAASDYDLMSNEMYWPQSDYHANSIADSSLGVNPASGLPMANDAIDIGGNVYGFGEASFVNYDHHTSQFSDFDYHNHS